MSNRIQNWTDSLWQPALWDRVYPLHTLAAENRHWRLRFRLFRLRNLDEQEKAEFFAKRPQWGIPELWDVNGKNDQGETPLHLAAHRNARKAATVLLRERADADAKAANGYTPLHTAVRMNARETATLLLAMGADANATDESGETPLHLAAHRNARRTTAVLLAKRADVNAKDVNGYTPLHTAVANSALDAAEILFKKGADVNAADRAGETPLHTAVANGALEAAKILLKKGADVNAADESGETPLHLAATKNTREIAVLLLESGAAISAKDASGDTPLHDAAVSSAVKIAELLIEKAADKEAYVRTENDRKNTPLHYVAKQDNEDAGRVWDLLVKHGADIDAQNEDGDTPGDAARARTDKMQRAKQLRPGGMLGERHQKLREWWSAFPWWKKLGIFATATVTAWGMLDLLRAICGKVFG